MGRFYEIPGLKTEQHATRMPRAYTLKEAVIDDIKFGALAKMNEVLRETLDAGTRPEDWSVDDKKKYFLILAVQDEILRRVEQTFAKRDKKPVKEGTRRRSK